MNIRLTWSLASTTVASLLVFGFALPVSAETSLALTASNVIAFANADRVALGAQPLIEDTVLNKAAQAKADDMATKGYFAHVDPSGNAPWVWFKKAGYAYRRAGENLGLNFTDAQSLEQAWMDSPTHRANIVKGAYTRMGIGIARGTYQGKPATFVVQFFATPYTAKVAAR